MINVHLRACLCFDACFFCVLARAVGGDLRRCRMLALSMGSSLLLFMSLFACGALFLCVYVWSMFICVRVCVQCFVFDVCV